VRPADAALSETDIVAMMAERKTARDEKDYARSDAIRDDLAACGVMLMDGDPLGWDWIARRG